MHSIEAQKLAAFVIAMPEFTMTENVDVNYGHIGAIVADAVLQANNNYARNVRPQVKKIRETYRDLTTTSSVLDLLSTLSATEFLSWKGVDKAERFLSILNLFQSESVETEEDLRAWLEDDLNIKKLRAINGIGPKTADYFKILVGLQTSAIDRHLMNFVLLAGCLPGTYENTKALIHETADVLSVTYATFDHSIWKYMSERVPSVFKSACVDAT